MSSHLLPVRKEFRTCNVVRANQPLRISQGSKVYLRRRNAIKIHLGSSHGNDENMKNTLKYFYRPGVQTESRNIRINTLVFQRQFYLVYVKHYRTSHSLCQYAAPPNNSPVCSHEQVISADQAWFKSFHSPMRLINAQKHIFFISPACNIKNQGLILHLATNIKV